MQAADRHAQRERLRGNSGVQFDEWIAKDGKCRPAILGL
jgi:hypothetical protein